MTDRVQAVPNGQRRTRKPERQGPFLIRETGSLVLPVRLTFYRGDAHDPLIALIEEAWAERQARLAAGGTPDESGVATLVVSLMIGGVGRFQAALPVCAADGPEADLDLGAPDG